MKDPVLLPRELLYKTSEIDQADWNYTPVLGCLQKQRFKLALRLLEDLQYRRLLEIGYGSGVFMPSLRGMCSELYGVDIHRHYGKVADTLQHIGIDAQLSCQSAENMNFPDDFFDAVVAVSSLEFVPNIIKAVKEIVRVTKSQGRFVLITPGNSRFVDWGLHVLTGRDAEKDFEGRREQVASSVAVDFKIDRFESYPRMGGCLFRIYSGFRLVPKKEMSYGEGVV
jgi:SAM-dependent methyltransferase